MNLLEPLLVSSSEKNDCDISIVLHNSGVVPNIMQFWSKIHLNETFNRGRDGETVCMSQS